ncbi:MAG: formimidoylglutamate deiminase [Actinomycetota bacterium]
MTQLWHAEHAWTSTLERDVLIEVVDGSIATVRPDQAAPPDAIVLKGLVLPGLVNAHSHAFHRALRGRTHRNGGDFWHWRDVMYSVAAKLDPDTYFELARATYAEMVLAGITSVGEFHYLHHDAGGARYADPNEMSQALLRAATEAGIRITLIDACYLRGGMRGEALDDVQRRFSDGDVGAWADRVAALAVSEGARIAGAIHSVRAVDRTSMKVVVDWAADKGAPLHMHVSEQRGEVEACMQTAGMTPVELIGEVGALGSGTTAVHATHLSGVDVELLGRSRTRVCMCPTTERDLADGVGPASVLIDTGAQLCLGSDSHAVIDLFEEARAVELDQRLATERRGLHAPEALLDAATRGGAESIGWDAGRLQVGALADFIAVDVAGPRLAGAGDDLVAAVVFAATASDVTDVVIGGRRVVEDRKHVAVGDVGAALGDAIGKLAT